MTLEENVETFLKQTPPFKKKLLLGFSGGEDSLALAHCLYALGADFALAHFDHGWRETSQKEAENLERWAKKRNIPFHTMRSQSPVATELAAREERYAFFEDLFARHPFAALILAHHQQDQAETILKRVFEGAHLTTLKGMQPISMKGKLPIWRPLLNTPKSAILTYIDKHKLAPIDDETNRNEKYLRGKMRTSLFPKLSEEYGKEITAPLSRLGTYAASLQSYLDERTRGFLPVRGPFGWMWEFSSVHPFEIEYILTSFFRDQGFIPSHHVLGEILSALQTKKADYRVVFAGQTLIIDRGRLFWLVVPIPHFPREISLVEGAVEAEGWKWKIAPTSKKEAKGGWEEWWKGKISLTLPKGDYSLHPNTGSFRKISNTCKVPAFLRPSLPILTEGGKPIREFLTGEIKGTKTLDHRSFTITLELKMEV